MSTESSPGNPADRQINLRVTEDMKEFWEKAAEAKGVPLSEFIRVAVQDEAAKLLVCQHPLEYRVAYPWSERCMRCGTRLRG